MSKISIKAKEFKSILEFGEKLVEHSNTDSNIFYIYKTDCIEFVVTTDHSQIRFKPKSAIEEEAITPYAFTPGQITKLGLNNDSNALLSWQRLQKGNSALSIKIGKMSASLKVAIDGYEYNCIQEVEQSLSVPIILLKEILDLCEIPCSYTQIRDDMLYFGLYTDSEMNLCAISDDGYSVINVKTMHKMLGPINIKIPRHIAIIAFSLSKEEEKTCSDANVIAGIGVNGHRVTIYNHRSVITFSTVSGENIDFKKLLVEQTKNVNVSYVMSTDKMIDEIKPMTQLIPAKDRTGAYIISSFKNNQALYTLSHREIGTIESNCTDVVSNVYIEKGVPECHVNLHPQAFFDFTSIAKKIPLIKVMCSSQSVYYEGANECKGIQYVYQAIFPTVQI